MAAVSAICRYKNERRKEIAFCGSKRDTVSTNFSNHYVILNSMWLLRG